MLSRSKYPDATAIRAQTLRARKLILRFKLSFKDDALQGRESVALLQALHICCIIAGLGQLASGRWPHVASWAVVQQTVNSANTILGPS